MQNKLISSFGRRKARKLRVTSQKTYQDILPLLRIDSTNLVRNQAWSLKTVLLNLFQHLFRSRNKFGITAKYGHFNKRLTPSIFQNNPSEIWLEIGFGGGEHMLEQLAQNPSVAMVGCEPFMNGVAKFVAQILPKDYDRVRIWHEDVRYLLDQIPSSFFARAFILFPDPWPKTRQQHRRLITSEFISKLLPTLKEGALLHVASDDSSYVEQIQKILYPHPKLILCEGPPSANPATWGERPEGWPVTRYEQKAMTQGKKCAYMVFQKKENHQ